MKRVNLSYTLIYLHSPTHFIFILAMWILIETVINRFFYFISQSGFIFLWVMRPVKQIQIKINSICQPSNDFTNILWRGGTGRPRSSNLALVDPICFHSTENVGDISILFGSCICCLGLGWPGNTLPLYPLNSGSLFAATA